MSYARGQAPSAKSPVRIGTRARTDPVLSVSTMIASGILREVAPYPAWRRRSVLRKKLDKLQPGLAREVLSKSRQLQRQGYAENQAVFDGLRLALANRFAATVSKVARAHGHAVPSNEPISGLGSLGAVGRDIACTILGAGTLASTIAMTFENPSGTEATTQAGQVGSSIAGCNREQLESQARIAEANARAAEAEAAIAAGRKKSNTPLYIALGAGAFVLLIGGVILLKPARTPAPAAVK